MISWICHKCARVLVKFASLGFAAHKYHTDGNGGPVHVVPLSCDVTGSSVKTLWGLSLRRSNAPDRHSGASTFMIRPGPHQITPEITAVSRVR
jgi:hypothetical protein